MLSALTTLIAPAPCTLRLAKVEGSVPAVIEAPPLLSVSEPKVLLSTIGVV